MALIAYGQTGSGKTFTMRGGTGEQQGLIPRAVRFLFDHSERLRELDWEVVFNFRGNLQIGFKASFLEVYNDEVFDLLKSNRDKLDVKVGSGKVAVEELSHLPITNKDDVGG